MTLDCARTYGPDAGARSHKIMLAATLAIVLVMTLLVPAQPADATAAAFTTVDPAVVWEDACKNGISGVNCNIYEAGYSVWLNGGPSGAALLEGDYVFAVGQPGFQGNIDGPMLLSTTSLAERSFSVSSTGAITLASGSSHDFAENRIELDPYTASVNGVYIAAICAAPTSGQAVQTRTCKFDMFKVQAGDTVLPVQSNFSGTKYEDTNGNGVWDTGEAGLAGWTINVYKDGTLVTSKTTDSLGNWEYTTPTATNPAAAAYTFCEVTAGRTGWQQTGPVAATVLEVSALSATPSLNTTHALAPCYNVAVAADTSASVAMLDFFNRQRVQHSLSGRKIRDDNGNGALDSGEPGLAGWTINISKQTGLDGDGNPVYAAVTSLTTTSAPVDVDNDPPLGSWSWSSGYMNVGTGSTTYKVCEGSQTGWRQTAPTTNGGCYLTTLANDANGSGTALNFFNVARGSISGVKFFGTGSSGTGLPNWPIKLYDAAGTTVVASTTTDINGAYSFTNLLPGTYQVHEVQANSTDSVKWRQTFPASPGTYTSQGLAAATPTALTGRDFGNMCQVPTMLNGRTKGFWHNKNGKTALENWMKATYTGTNTQRTAAGYAYLSTLVDPTFAKHDHLAEWLKASDASTMRVMLQAQWMATKLNVLTGITPDVAVEWPVGSGDSRLISTWLDDASSGGTWPGDRAEQESLKNLFDTINNQKIVESWNDSSTPCSRTFPTG